MNILLSKLSNIICVEILDIIFVWGIFLYGIFRFVDNFNFKKFFLLFNSNWSFLEVRSFFCFSVCLWIVVLLFFDFVSLICFVYWFNSCL